MISRFFDWLIHLRHTWVLLIAAALLLVNGVVALRGNFDRMQELKSAVVEADQNDPEALPQAIDDLRGYIFEHMNTSTEIQLAGSYERAADKIIEESLSGLPGNVDIFADLPVSCSGGNRVYLKLTTPCAQEHINRKIAELDSNNPKPPQLPKKEAYIYSFAAPIVSFDAAGLSLVGAAGLGLTWALIALLKFLHHELTIRFK